MYRHGLLLLHLYRKRRNTFRNFSPETEKQGEFLPKPVKILYILPISVQVPINYRIKMKDFRVINIKRKIRNIIRALISYAYKNQVHGETTFKSAHSTVRSETHKSVLSQIHFFLFRFLSATGICILKYFSKTRSRMRIILFL